MKETKNYKEATPKEVAQWEQTDFFRSGNFSAMKLLVVVPALIQIIVFGMMLLTFMLNDVLF